MQNRRLNQKGVTLVEVMISLVILLIVFLGLIQASLISINSNLRNLVRDGATSMASEYMSRAKATPIDTLAPGGIICNDPINPTNANNINVNLNRQVRNIWQPYSVRTSSCFTDASLNNAWVTVTVTYVYPGDVAANLQTTTINSIVTRPS